MKIRQAKKVLKANRVTAEGLPAWCRPQHRYNTLQRAINRMRTVGECRWVNYRLIWYPYRRPLTPSMTTMQRLGW